MPSLTFDKAVQRYRNARGQFVSRVAVVGARQAIVNEVINQVTTLTNNLRDGKIDLGDWQSGMRETIKAGHQLSAAIVGGGKASMSSADWLVVARNVKAQYRYLDAFAYQIERGVGGINMGRARMYANAIRGTFLNFEKLKRKEAGFARVRWVVSARESCQGCLSAKGEWLIDEVPEIGSHQCLSNCLCFLEYLRQ